MVTNGKTIMKTLHQKKVTKLPLAEIQEPNQKLNRKITEKELK